MATNLLSLPDELLLSIYAFAFSDIPTHDVPTRFLDQVALAPTHRLRWLAEDAFYDTITLHITVNVSAALEGTPKTGINVVQREDIQLYSRILKDMRDCSFLGAARNVKVLIMCGQSDGCEERVLGVMEKVAGEGGREGKEIEVGLWMGDEKRERAVTEKLKERGIRRILGRQEMKGMLFGE